MAQNLQMNNNGINQHCQPGYILDPANKPFEVHTYNHENEVPWPHRRWQLLDNPVHPLWRWQAWKDYELNPVQSGPAEADLHFDPVWQPRKQDVDYLDDELLHFSREYRLFHTPPQNTDNTFRLGITCCARNTDADFMEFATKVPVISAIAAETIQEFGPVRWDSKPVLDRFVVSLNLAQTLVHELAHAIFYRRKYLENMFQSDQDYKWWAGWEPQVFENQGNELGLNLCQWLFGFEFSLPWGIFKTVDEEARRITKPPCRPMLNGRHGLFATKGFTWLPIEYYVVSRKTLKWLFDKTTWMSMDPIPLHLIGPVYQQIHSPITNSNPSDPHGVDSNIFDLNHNDPTPVNPDLMDPNPFDPYLIDPSLGGTQPTGTTHVDPNFNFVDPHLMNPSLIDWSLVNPNDVDPNFVIPNFLFPRPIDPGLVNANPVNPNHFDPNLIDPVLLYLNQNDSDSGSDDTSTIPLGLNLENTAYTFT